MTSSFAEGKRPWKRPQVERSASPARLVALRLLVSLRLPRAAGFDVLLDEERRLRRLSNQDAALAREIAYGVCRHRRWLQEVLRRYLHKGLPDKAYHVEESLLIGAYQAIFLDKIPAHSIVDETVKLVGSVRTEASYRGLANAIMRKIVAAPKEEMLPTDDTPWPIRHGVPDWLASQAGDVYTGEELEKFFASSNEPAPLHFRAVYTETSDGEALLTQLKTEIIDQTHAIPVIAKGSYGSDCFKVEARGLSPDTLPLFQRGRVTIEDEAAQIVCHLADPQPGMRIWDVCASPGGKTTHLADLAKRQAELVVASDISEEKLVRLNDTVRRLGLSDHIRVMLADDVYTGFPKQSFDLVLVDAPCSSLGTLRRHPEVRYRRHPKQIKTYADRQLSILESGASRVKPGGKLVYSVCTFMAAETDGVADSFLKRNPDFIAGEAPTNLPFDAAGFAAGPGRFRTAPHRHDCDGFFVAIFQRAASG